MRLVPRNPQLIELLSRASQNLVEISNLLVELFAGFPASLPVADRIREHEAIGDELTHQLVRLLDSSFVVPYDREDLHALSGRLDDVCDHIDEAASQMVVYGVRHVPETAVAQAEVVRDACLALAGAVERMEDPSAANERLVEVHTLENAGDRLLRQAIADLFAGNTDALVVIRWKDIHEQLESAVDACESAAHVLESAFLKGW
ncbi:MAG TPA: DUF47 family protein [Gaiellales bacterium]|jgi:hypothetical protein